MVDQGDNIPYDQRLLLLKQSTGIKDEHVKEY